ncbi:hypothetical protein HanPSC8_Chr15g0650421 [Helianthus annuus]|nr:hypothetical protein HanPSC8_Chr15g0650421 [Helianthus annuus]
MNYTRRHRETLIFVSTATSQQKKHHRLPDHHYHCHFSTKETPSSLSWPAITTVVGSFVGERGEP